MKKQILMLVIGILIGAMATTGVFLVLKGKTPEQRGRMDRGDRMEMGEPPSMDEDETNGEMRNARPNNKEMQNNEDSSNTNPTDSEV